MTMTPDVLIVAHRGASLLAPENTMCAFRRAIELSADGIELDVRATKDNVIVVSHDDAIDRVSDGKGLISDYTYDELCRFNFGYTFQDAQPERIPTLREVCELIAPTGMFLNVEIKQAGIEEAVLRETATLDNRILFSSFDHYSMHKIKKLNASARVGLLYSEILFKPWRYARKLGAEAVHPNYVTLFMPGIVRKCREHEVFVNAWTIDDPDVMRRLMKKGVNAIITNDVEMALNVRDNG